MTLMSFEEQRGAGGRRIAHTPDWKWELNSNLGGGGGSGGRKL